MNTNSRITVVFVMLISFVVTGCGPGQLFGPTLTPTPTPLTDEEFAEYAVDVCSTLKTDFTSINTFDFTSRAEAYRRAADSLTHLEITEQSAPQGTQLRIGLSELADSYGFLDKALTEAVDKANIDTTAIDTLFFGEDGSVYAVSQSIFDITKLEIEETLLTELYANATLVQEAAISLGLEDCIPEISGNDN